MEAEMSLLQEVQSMMLQAVADDPVALAIMRGDPEEEATWAGLTGDELHDLKANLLTQSKLVHGLIGSVLRLAQAIDEFH
jgi:hypothetical protein